MTTSSPTTAPYGSWRSPITADAIVAESISIGQVAIDGDAILWTEGPALRGRPQRHHAHDAGRRGLRRESGAVQRKDASA